MFMYLPKRAWLNNGVNDRQIKVFNFNDSFRCDRDDRSG